MAQMLIVNPHKRGTHKRRAKNPTAHARRRTHARRANPAKRRTRRSNPMHPLAKMRSYVRRRTHARRANPIRRRRHRNPINGASIMRSLKPMLMHAIIGGAGAIAVETLWTKLSPRMPATLTNGYAGVGVKALATVALGVMLDRPTRGMSRKLAEGSLVKQSYDVMLSIVGKPLGLGYYSPLAIVNQTPRFNPTGRVLSQGGRTGDVGAFSMTPVPGVRGAPSRQQLRMLGDTGAFVNQRVPFVQIRGAK